MSNQPNTLSSENQTINGHHIHYLKLGTGKEAVLFLHGWLNHSGLWRNSMLAAGKNNTRYTFYALDLPGFGASDQPQKPRYATIDGLTEIVIRFCQTLNISSCTLVGHSMGGMISLKTALEKPQLVNKLFLVSPAVTGKLGKPLDPILKWNIRLYAMGLSFVKQSRFLFYKYTQAFYHKMNEVEQWQQVFQNAQKHPSIEQARSLRSITNTNLAHSLKHIQIPTVVVFGEHDQTVPVTESQVLQQHLPNVHLHLMPDTAHMPMDEDPQTFNNLLLDFLSTNN